MVSASGAAKDSVGKRESACLNPEMLVATFTRARPHVALDSAIALHDLRTFDVGTRASFVLGHRLDRVITEIRRRLPVGNALYLCLLIEDLLFSPLSIA
jgi:hypothetical protein